MLRGLRTVIYPSPDLERARTFWSGLLGQKPYFDQPFYVGYDVRGYELGLVPDATPSTDGPGAHWAVDDLAEALARVVALGGAVLEEPRDVGDGIVVAAARDVSGNRFGLIVNPHFRAEVGSRVAATGATSSDRTIVVTARVAAPPERVWALWTTREGLSEWLVPDARIELRIGGPYEFYFRDGPRGLRGGEDNVVLAFLAPRLLAFTWNAPPELSTRDDHTQVWLELRPVPGGTEVVLTHGGWPRDGLADASGDWPKTVVYFERAWRAVMDALSAHCGPAPG